MIFCRLMKEGCKDEFSSHGLLDMTMDGSGDFGQFAGMQAEDKRGRGIHRCSLILLVLLLLAGTAVRVYRFPGVPAGLQQDEVSEAYESFCLLHTGADRWGYHLPVYFLGWGSGQNVLQAYLTIPVVAIWGLTPFSARLVTLVCSLVSLPLFFLVLRRWYGENAALWGLLFLALCPWHIVLSRWGLECNPLPFFLLLGVFLFGRALDSVDPWAIVPCLIPFALCLYTYGIVVAVLPVLLVLLAAVGFRQIKRNWRAWMGAAGVFVLVSLPIGFFIFKNYVTKKNYGFERWLPFSAPLLPVTRLAEIRAEGGSVLRHNAIFLRHSLQDGSSWNQVPGFGPIQKVVLALAIVGLIGLMVRAIRERRLSEPFLPWLLASVPVMLLIPVKLNEAITVFLPLLAMAGYGVSWVIGGVREWRFRVLIAAACLGPFLFQTVRFVGAYFGPEYAVETAPIFRPEIPAALKDVDRLAGRGEPIYVSHFLILNYVYTAFYERVDPHLFQKSGATYDHPDFGPYRFSRATAAEMPRPFVFLREVSEAPLCTQPMDVAKYGNFVVGDCR
jgi:hypothetical protein